MPRCVLALKPARRAAAARAAVPTPSQGCENPPRGHSRPVPPPPLPPRPTPPPLQTTAEDLTASLHKQYAAAIEKLPGSGWNEEHTGKLVKHLLLAQGVGAKDAVPPALQAQVETEFKRYAFNEAQPPMLLDKEEEWEVAGGSREKKPQAPQPRTTARPQM